jgi:hypothetical protein
MFIRTYFLSTLVKLGPPKFRRAIVNIFSSFHPRTHKLKEIIDVIQNTSTEIFEAKKNALAKGDEVVAQQIGAGKDLLSILSRSLACMVSGLH